MTPSDTDSRNDSDSDGDTEVVDDTDTDTDSDTDTDPHGDGRNLYQQCDHVGYLDAWTPRFLDLMELESDEGWTYYPYVRYSDDHPGWRLERYVRLELWGFGGGVFTLSDGTGSRAAVEDPDVSVRPEAVLIQERGELTQVGNALTIEAPSYAYTCTRHVRPANPIHPNQQVEFRCVEPDGKRSVWWGFTFDPVDRVRAECLAQHEPPQHPTRWGLWQTRRAGEAEWTSAFESWVDGETFRWQMTDLWLGNDGGGAMVTLEQARTRERERLADVKREEYSLSWTRGASGTLAFEGDLPMTCSPYTDLELFGGDSVYSYETYGLLCVDADGFERLFAPTRMDWPWGWGSHDTPEGWWWDPDYNDR